MLMFLKDSGFRFVVVLTKCDKLNKSEREKNRAMLKEEMSFVGDVPFVEFSATTGEGNEALRAFLEEING